MGIQLVKLFSAQYDGIVKVNKSGTNGVEIGSFFRKVICAVKNRAIADIMRTLAHELAHHKQHELGMIGPKDTDNQELEDQANVYAGRLVRWFGRENKEIYKDLQ
jgi:Zn-dependent peptidase ImmA (M78 family)